VRAPQHRGQRAAALGDALLQPGIVRARSVRRGVAGRCINN